jgi:hypothetical protein
MMADELNISKENIRCSSVKIYGRGGSAQKFVPHRQTDEQKRRRSCQGFIQICKENHIFLLHFLFPNVTTALKAKRSQDAEDIKTNMAAEKNAVPLEAFVGCLQKLFKPFNTCIQVGGDYFEYK